MITLLIPTMNRSEFLIRQLNYYRDVGFQGYICIGDSSNAEHLKRMQKAMELFSGNLNIIYKEYPDLNDANVLKRLLEFVVTPYAVWVGDDDFLIPSALEQCELFLNSHPDYSAAHGAGMALSLQSSGPYGQVAWVRPYEQAVIEDGSAAQRLLHHLNHYAAIHFAVHRTESWREMYKDVSLIPDRTFSCELLPNCLSVILGKVKELDYLHLMRQSHDQRYNLPGTREWVNTPHWQDSYQIFCDSLARELANVDSISINEAQNIVRQAFQVYLNNIMGKSVLSHRGISRLREVAGMLPGVRRVWNALHSLKSERREETSLLSALLQPSSPYHADFMPIYRTVTTKPVEFPLESSQQG